MGFFVWIVLSTVSFTVGFLLGAALAGASDHDERQGELR